jgi:type IV pilus assembly protein PilX
MKVTPDQHAGRWLSGRPYAAQSGAALITGLVILAIMTLIGISSLRSVTLDERMSRNLLDTNSAFQAAEAGLQAGLQYLEQQTAPITPSDSGSQKVWTGCRVSSGTIPDCQTEAGASHVCCQLERTITNWLTSAPAGGIELPDLTGGEPLDGIASDYQPRVFIEERFMPKADAEEAARGAGIHYYTVTAVGIGANPSSRSVLQTTIPRVYAW